MIASRKPPRRDKLPGVSPDGAISHGAEGTPQTGDTQCGKSAVLDLDALDLRLRLGSLGQLDRQNPVLEGCLRLFAIHTGGERNCPVDRAVAALGQVIPLFLLLALDLLLPLHSQHVIVDRHLDVLHLHARQLDRYFDRLVGLDHVGFRFAAAEGPFEMTDTVPEVLEHMVHFALECRDRVVFAALGIWRAVLARPGDEVFDLHDMVSFGFQAPLTAIFFGCASGARGSLRVRTPPRISASILLGSKSSESVKARSKSPSPYSA